MGVLKFYNMLRSGITWKGPESIELWYQDHGGSSRRQKTVYYKLYAGDHRMKHTSQNIYSSNNSSSENITDDDSEDDSQIKMMAAIV